MNASSAREHPQQTADTLLRRIVSLNSSDQLRGLDDFGNLMENLGEGGFPFYEAVSSEAFTSGLRRVIDRKSPEVNSRLVHLIDLYGKRFEPISDLLPGLVSLRSELVSLGLISPQEICRTHDNFSSEQDSQDPEEFLAEVSATLRLFNEVASVKKDKQALITLALNIDRYQEQLEMWINMLDDGNFSELKLRASEILANSEKALDLYRSLRI